jgi:hypothetical protein
MGLRTIYQCPTHPIAIPNDGSLCRAALANRRPGHSVLQFCLVWFLEFSENSVFKNLEPKYVSRTQVEPKKSVSVLSVRFRFLTK